MSNTSPLTKGANTSVAGNHVAVRVSGNGGSVDVSALLLNANGKVRADADLVFYNNPRHDGIETSGDTVTANLLEIPADVVTVAVVASVDTDSQPGTTFNATTTPSVQITHGGDPISFRPLPLTAGETVAVLIELYRRGGGWKARAVGQGYDTGLAGPP